MPQQNWANEMLFIADGNLIVLENDETVAIAISRFSIDDKQEREADACLNAERLVACANACGGIDTETLDRYPACVLTLLEALQRARPYLVDTECDMSLVDHALGIFHGDQPLSLEQEILLDVAQMNKDIAEILSDANAEDDTTTAYDMGIHANMVPGRAYPVSSFTAEMKPDQSYAFRTVDTLIPHSCFAESLD